MDQYNAKVIDVGQWLGWERAAVRGSIIKPGSSASGAERRNAYSPDFQTYVCSNDARPTNIGALRTFRRRRS